MIGVRPFANIPDAGIAAVFLLIVILVAIGLYIRLKIHETRAFARHAESVDGSHERGASAAGYRLTVADARRATELRRIELGKFSTAGVRL